MPSGTEILTKCAIFIGIVVFGTPIAIVAMQLLLDYTDNGLLLTEESSLITMGAMSVLTAMALVYRCIKKIQKTMIEVGAKHISDVCFGGLEYHRKRREQLLRSTSGEDQESSECETSFQSCGMGETSPVRKRPLRAFRVRVYHTQSRNGTLRPHLMILGPAYRKPPMAKDTDLGQGGLNT